MEFLVSFNLLHCMIKEYFCVDERTQFSKILSLEAIIKKTKSDSNNSPKP